MPKYDYLCTECISTFEERVSIDDRNLTQACPSCNTPAERIFTPAAISITTNFSNLRVTKYHDYHGFDSTPEHTAEYLYRKKDEENVERIYNNFKPSKEEKSLEQRVREDNPGIDMQLDRVITKAEIAKALDTMPVPVSK